MKGKNMSYIKSLKCKECSREYSISPVHVCEFCFGPLEGVYDYEKIKESLTREKIEARPKSMWRYRELLPLNNDPSVGMNVGYTPLIRAERLAKALGVKELWIKNDAVNHPTLSFKDRVVSVALSRALELGFSVVGCASHGHLANSVGGPTRKAQRPWATRSRSSSGGGCPTTWWRPWPVGR